MSGKVTRNQVRATTACTAVALVLVVTTLVAPGWQRYDVSSRSTKQNGTYEYASFYVRICIPEDKCRTVSVPESWDWSGLNDDWLKFQQFRLSYQVLGHVLLLGMIVLSLALQVWALRAASWKSSFTAILMVATSVTASYLWEVVVDGTVYGFTQFMLVDDLEDNTSMSVTVQGQEYDVNRVKLPWNSVIQGLAALFITLVALYSTFMFVKSDDGTVGSNQLQDGTDQAPVGSKYGRPVHSQN